MTSTSGYENLRRVAYECDEGSDACFIPVCEKCKMFVKANDTIKIGIDTLVDEPNCVCKRCGKSKMIFEGFV